MGKVKWNTALPAGSNYIRIQLDGRGRADLVLIRLQRIPRLLALEQGLDILKEEVIRKEGQAERQGADITATIGVPLHSDTDAAAQEQLVPHGHAKLRTVIKDQGDLAGQGGDVFHDSRDLLFGKIAEQPKGHNHHLRAG